MKFTTFMAHNTIGRHILQYLGHLTQNVVKDVTIFIAHNMQLRAIE